MVVIDSNTPNNGQSYLITTDLSHMVLSIIVRQTTPALFEIRQIRLICIQIR